MALEGSLEIREQKACLSGAPPKLVVDRLCDGIRGTVSRATSVRTPNLKQAVTSVRVVVVGDDDRHSASMSLLQDLEHLVESGFDVLHMVARVALREGGPHIRYEPPISKPEKRTKPA